MSQAQEQTTDRPTSVAAAKQSAIISTCRPNLRARAVRVGAKSSTDFVLFDCLWEQRKSMRSAAGGNEADEVAHNMASIYDLVLKYGRFFEPSPRPKKYKPGDRHQCYGNSLDLVMADDGLSYCEGYVVVQAP